MARIVYAGIETDGGGNIMRLVSRLMVLTVGVVLVALMDSGAAAQQPCAGLLTLQDVTSVMGPGYALAGGGVSTPTVCVYTKGVIGIAPANRVTLTLQDEAGGAAPKLVELSSGYRKRGAPVVAASGLGPGAFYIDADTGLNFLVFGKEKLLLSLGVYAYKTRNVKAALALAKLVYGRF